MAKSNLKKSVRFIEIEYLKNNKNKKINRKSKIPNKSPLPMPTPLENYRQQLDQIDSEILDLLTKRFEITKKVGEYKKANNITKVQDPAREQNMLRNLSQKAQNKELNPDLIKHIWRLILDQSVIDQQKIIFYQK
ncbi:hypothetical protein GF376_03560 [Candidatus Peregrinibacteria bacterium]|nr:hypothetical protein [Candidatus Peregrinibacteria bacterium]